jgi:hypothetical protein
MLTRFITNIGSIILVLMAAPASAQEAAQKPKIPLVLVVGCANPGEQPHIWTLSHVGQRTEVRQPAISSDEQAQAAKQPLGAAQYELIGIADFVSPDLSLKIGDRSQILSPERANTTGKLAKGFKVAVKGLYIAGGPPRINVTSVVDLAPTCP